MKEKYIAKVKSEISEKLINPNFDPNNKEKSQELFEQYKLLVDSAHKGEEKRGNSSNIFLGVNSLIASFLIHPATVTHNLETKDLSISVLFTFIGIFISWEWLRVIRSYKNLNFINYVMINALEALLPSSTFSLRAKIEMGIASEKSSNVGNAVLVKENLLPLAFILLYLIYFVAILFSLFSQ